MEDATIAAISTGMTNAGIGKIRLSGSKALEIVNRIYRSKESHQNLLAVKSHTIHYGYIYDGEVLIDEVLILVMKAPRSYTTEDIVEIDCHGGIVVMQKIMETVIKNGARPAEPGEFTKRAFLNGRIDLTQAEAVIDVINSKNEFALMTSVKQLKGNILEKINDIRDNIIGDIAYIEAAMDDPEHIGIDGFNEELLTHVNHNIAILKKLLDSSNDGRMIKEGIHTVIVGKPNAGKSSLLNLLVGDEKAIVTEIAGTTRDILEDYINIKGIPLHIIDTAGIRNTEDIVEKIGVHKAKEFAGDADLIIYVVDGTTPIDENDFEIIEFIKNKKVIILLNKIDLESVITKKDIVKYLNKPVIEISTKEETGIEELEFVLKEMFFEGKISFNDEIYITNIRHKEAIKASIESLTLVLNSINEGLPEDFFSIDLMNAYQVLGSMIGESVGEDLIDKIFSDFCMGK